ncbi:MAG: 3-oxoadipate enol-lactonase [Granulosicoccus sp.]|jgi:3-oxoadipate enol-lactonase
MPFTAKTNIKLHYEIQGEGNRIIYISGTGGDLRVKPNLLDGPLPKSNQVLAFDQRGLGQSEKPETNYTMLEYADDAAQLMAELSWESADVIGVSFGGMVALNMAVHYPNKINKLVLCCTSPGGREQASYPLHELPESLSDVDRICQMMSINDLRRDADWQNENPAQVQEIIRITMNMRPADHQTDEFKAGARRQLLARSQHDVVDLLTDIKIPTLICAGKYDGMAPARNQEIMHELMPSSELVWFEGGHLFLIQDKAAWPTIIEFLDSE